MKPILSLIIISCFLATSALFQNNNTLKGKMLFLSSGKTPAQGVTISGSIKEIENTNKVYTTDDGSYVLVFPRARDGHRVDLTIGEEDQHGKQIEVVNEKEVEICRISADYQEEFEIIVCPKGSRDLAAQKYYKIIKTSSDLALAKMKEEMDALLAQQEKDYNLIAEYSDKIAKLEEQTDSLSIYREAFHIASINKDNASRRVLRYIQLLDEGKSILEAREALSIKDAASDLNQSLVLFKAAIEELETRAGASVSIYDYDDAITCYDTIISYAERMGIDPLRIAQYYANSAAILLKDGKYKNALIYEEKALGIRQELLNFQDPNLATSFNNIGIVFTKMGEYSKALEYANKAIDIRKEIYDLNHASIAESYNDIGLIHRALGEYEKALEYLEKALDINEEIFEPLHPSIAMTYNNIGITQINLGDRNKALEYFKKALEINEEILEPFHPSLATSYDNIGAAYGALGEHYKSLEYRQKALDIKKEILNPKHPSLATTYNNIGTSYKFIEEYDKAIENLKKALDIRKEIFEPLHPLLSVSYSNLGWIYRSVGEYGKSLEYAKKALEIQEETYDPNHRALAISYHNIGNTYRSMGEYDKAFEYAKKALDSQEETLDSNHPFLSTLYGNFAYACRSIGEYEKALIYDQKSLDIRKRIYNPNHPSIATTYNNIGFTYVKLNQFKEAHEAFTIYESMNPKEGRSFRNWAMYYALQGEKEKALANLRHAVELGYDGLNWLETDDSMDSLRDGEEFKAIIESLKKEKK